MDRNLDLIKELSLFNIFFIVNDLPEQIVTDKIQMSTLNLTFQAIFIVFVSQMCFSKPKSVYPFYNILFDYQNDDN